MNNCICIKNISGKLPSVLYAPKQLRYTQPHIRGFFYYINNENAHKLLIALFILWLWKSQLLRLAHSTPWNELIQQPDKILWILGIHTLPTAFYSLSNTYRYIQIHFTSPLELKENYAIKCTYFHIICENCTNIRFRDKETTTLNYIYIPTWF